MFVEKLKNVIRRGLGIYATSAECALRTHRNVDIVLSAALREPDVPSSICDPVAYVDFLRACIEPVRHRVTEVKADVYPANDAAKRFANLVDALPWGLPPINLSVAKEIARIADAYRALSESHESAQWVGDLGLYFSMSSSFGDKPRRRRGVEIGAGGVVFAR